MWIQVVSSIYQHSDEKSLYIPFLNSDKLKGKIPALYSQFQQTVYLQKEEQILKRIWNGTKEEAVMTWFVGTHYSSTFHSSIKLKYQVPHSHHTKISVEYKRTAFSLVKQLTWSLLSLHSIWSASFTRFQKFIKDAKITFDYICFCFLYL